jgi:hypothetical protein
MALATSKGAPGISRNASCRDAPQPLPDAITEDEAGVEARNHRLGARMKLAVDVDEDVAVARIVGAVVRPWSSVCPSPGAVTAGARHFRGL